MYGGKIPLSTTGGKKSDGSMNGEPLPARVEADAGGHDVFYRVPLVHRRQYEALDGGDLHPCIKRALRHTWANSWQVFRPADVLALDVFAIKRCINGTSLAVYAS